MKLAGCKPFCTGCLSFLALHELRWKHLQMLVAVPSAEAMLLDMLRAISRDPAWPAIQQCLTCVLYLEMRFLLQGLVLCKALKCMLKCSSALSQECWFQWILGGMKESSIQPGSCHVSAARNPGHKSVLGRRWECLQFVPPSLPSEMRWRLSDEELLHGQYCPQESCQHGLGT